MTIVNLTPHVINTIRKDGVTVDFAPTGVVARVATTPVEVGEMEGIALRQTTFGEVIDLPEPQEGTFYIVSSLVRSAAPDRLDVVSPGALLRDEDGKPVGCDGFAVNG